MLDIIRQAVEGMTREEKESLVAELKALVFAELDGPSADPSACPRCGHSHVVRKGLDRDGSRRWLCRGCRRTFGAKTFGLIARSRLPREKWARLVELTVDAASVARCARELGVTTVTAWFMRMRLCEAMRRSMPAPPANGEWQVDGTYLDESLKGLRGEAMPREAHRTGHDVRERGISNMKVCVVCGVEAGGGSFCVACDRGRPTDAALRASLEGRVGRGAAVTTDGHQAFGRVLAGLGVARHDEVDRVAEADGRLRAVNELHGRLGLFLARFRGVSTRWLQRYLWWFEWTELARRSADARAALAEVAAAGTYVHTRASMLGSGRPFFEYWEQLRASAEAA